MRRLTIAVLLLANEAFADQITVAPDPELPGMLPSTPEIQLPIFPEILSIPAEDPLEYNSVLQQLGHELSRAVSQGMVEVDAFPNDLSDVPFGEWPLPVERSNLSVTTGLDRDVSARRDDNFPAPDGSICVADADVDVGGWANPNDALQMGRLRRASIAEDGGYDKTGAEALTRYYVAMGFGIEAAAIGENITRNRQNRVLLAMADVVDYGASDAPIFDSQIYCTGKIALWAALSRPIPAEIEETDHILRAFSGLPYHLRSHLGPLLAERMQDAGLSSEARLVLNAVTRAGANSAESELMAARLGLSGTRAAAARETLIRLSNSTGIVAASALLDLMLDAEKRKIPPDPQWVADIPSHIRATEGTEIAAQLNLAGLRALIGLNEFDIFRARLFASGAFGVTEIEMRSLSALAVEAAADHVEDATFLRTEIGLSSALRPDDLPRDTRFDLIRRLINLGLPDRSLRYLPSDPQNEKEFSLILRLLSLTGQSEKAISMAKAETHPLVLSALGEIFERQNDDLSAQRAFDKGGDIESAAAAAMRNGQWNWIADKGESEIAGAIGSLTSETEAFATNAELLEYANRRQRFVELVLAKTSLD